ncbi:MAG: hypothetical protein MR215_07705 [Bacteroidales bacterium]|nr:hypothetical protein [Bacteroidales bacterium]MDD7724202.1 hypothetical protein [Bacteroidales bacterium]MDY4175207.1 hypothetical protein [Bacteroidales bacterium]
MNKRLRNTIVSTLTPQAATRHAVEAAVSEKFESLCSVLENLAAEYRELLDPQVVVKFERQARHVGVFTLDADVLVFVQLTDVFQFDREHEAMASEYVKSQPSRSFVGTVHVYNFLADSFKYDRDEDNGYLVARIFINSEEGFFVEGKRQRNMGVSHYGEQLLTRENWRKVAETAFKYAVEENPLVPPYELVMQTDMATLKQYIMTSKIKTAKRMGFGFRADDVK